MSGRVLKKFWKKAFKPITIMFIPHDSNKPLNIRIPSIGIIICAIFWCVGTFYVFTRTVDTLEYEKMKHRVNNYDKQFRELEGTISKLKESEVEFKRLLAFRSKEEMLDNYSQTNDEDGDFVNLKKQIAKSVESVGIIKTHLRKERDIYRSTPLGLPVSGKISSHFGMRIHPIDGNEHFHNGIDITTNSGNPVRATADGVVSFSGWYGAYGNVVVVEHGFGFSTLYSHNKTNIATVGQRVKRGDTVAYVGSTGNAQSPHVHYSIYKDGKPLNPLKIFKGER